MKLVFNYDGMSYGFLNRTDGIAFLSEQKAKLTDVVFFGKGLTPEEKDVFNGVKAKKEAVQPQKQSKIPAFVGKEGKDGSS